MPRPVSPLRRVHLDADVSLKIFLFFLLIVPTLYQGIKFTVIFIQQPTSTHFETELMGYDDVKSIVVCTQYGIPTETMQSKTMAYASGYSVNNDMVDHGDPGSPYRQIKSSADAVAQARQEYEKAIRPDATAHQLLANISDIRVVERDGNTGKLEIKKPTITPNFVASSYSCASVPNQKNSTERGGMAFKENIKGEMLDMPQFWYTTTTPPVTFVEYYAFHFVSLYDVKPMAFLDMRKHFMFYDYEIEEPEGGWEVSSEPGGTGGDGPGSEGPQVVHGHGSGSNTPLTHARSAIISTDIFHYHRLNTRSEKCVKEEGSFPVGFLSRRCALLCEDEAYQKVHKCSSLAFYEIDKEMGLKTDLPRCHLYDDAIPGTVKIPIYGSVNSTLSSQDLVKAKQKCMERERCDEQNHCDEWEVKVRSVLVNVEAVEGFQLEPGRELHLVSILLPDRVRTAKEGLTLDLETWIGTVGGIFGIYLGASFYAAIMALIDVYRQRKAQKATAIALDS